MATTAPSSSPSIKPNVVSKFNCVSNSSNSLIELETTLTNIIESSKCEKSVDRGVGDQNRTNEFSRSDFKVSSEPIGDASSDLPKLTMSSNGLNNNQVSQSFLESAGRHLNSGLKQKEINLYLSTAGNVCDSTRSLDADQGSLCQKNKASFSSANSCDIKIESDHYLSKKIRNGELCVSGRIECLDKNSNKSADNNLANSLDNSPDHPDNCTVMGNKTDGNLDNSLDNKPDNSPAPDEVLESEFDKLASSVHDRAADERTSSLIKDEQMNKRNRIKDNLIKCCDSGEQVNCGAEANGSNLQQADELVDRKESITEQMDTDNELFGSTKHSESANEDRSLTEDEQMDISQCDRTKSAAASRHLYSKQQDDCSPDSDHLANGSYSSSLCSTPSELSADLVYSEAGEQMDTTGGNADLSKKSINELLVSDGEPSEVTSNKKQRNKDSKQDESSDNQAAIKEQSDNSSKDDNLSSSDNSDKSSNNNSSIRVPDDVSFSADQQRLFIDFTAARRSAFIPARSFLFLSAH